MIRLKDKQEITLSQIDAVVAALNASGTRSPKVIKNGLVSIHTAILGEKK